ncbi:MAG TPA: S41 family peptidase [Candidatus Limnocylindrales bacterium]|nr:S41 family peptidase [Candidatus Limnocylindrales bacterium]
MSISTCITLMLLIGIALAQSTNSQDETLRHIGVFSDVMGYIKSQYVEEPDMKSVTLGALNGMLEAVDPFASYLNADQYKDYLKNKDIKKADVGLLLSRRYGYLLVEGAIPNSPAAKAGLGSGDMIESIKGIATRDMPLAYASMLLQGDSNTPVELSVVRQRHPEPQAVKLTRANIQLPNVDSRMLNGQVGYIQVGALSDAQVKEIASVVQKLQKDGARKLVLDLRNCAAGSPENGIALANLFLKSGRISSLKGQKVAEQDFDANPSKAITDLPLAVLTNHGTADGAEIAAAALQDDKRAQLVGERTYGDAAVRKAINMEDGGAIILSVAKYYSPGGKAIQDAFVTPAHVVADAEQQVDYDDNGEPIAEAQDQQQAPKKLEDDPVMKKALEVLGTNG